MTTRLLTLIIKEFKAIWKDPRSRMIVTIMPIIQLIVFANAVTMEVKNPIVTMEVKDFGTIKLELYPASKDRNRPSCVKIPTEVK